MTYLTLLGVAIAFTSLLFMPLLPRQKARLTTRAQTRTLTLTPTPTLTLTLSLTLTLTLTNAGSSSSCYSSTAPTL